MFFAFDTSSSSDKESKKGLAAKRKIIRQNSNVLSLPDNKFEEYFRLNKSAFMYVLEKLKPAMKSEVRTTSVSKAIKLAATLQFLGQGSYQTSVGNTRLLEAVVCPLWIKFHMTSAEKADAKEYFFQKTGFPGVFGCVDGTHIKILPPNKQDPNLYYNRNGFFSLNAMIVCDHKMRIRCFDARYAGSGHDSLIWNISQARRILKQRYDDFERNFWLLGDAGYPLEPFIKTPYRSATERSPEAIVNMLKLEI